MGEGAADHHFTRLLRAMSDIIDATGGTVIKTLGDGVLAVYTSATAGIVGAASLQRMAGEVRQPDAVELRVGISCGDVHSDGDDVQGTPVVEATRLCGAADRGQILASATVGLLANERSEYQLVPAGSRALKGLRAEVAVLDVQWERAPGTRALMFPMQLRGTSPYVGQASNLHTALRVWQSVNAGTGRLIAVSGETGIGKTRFAGRIAERAVADGAIVLYGRSREGLDAPYQPIVEALHPYAARCDEVMLRAQIGDGADHLARLLPELAARVSGVQPAPTTDRWSLFQAVADFVAQVARVQGLVVVLDDLQWSESSTLLLVRHLAQSAIPRLLLIVTWRSGDGPDPPGLVDTLAELHRSRVADHVRLGGLSESEISELIAGLGGAPPDRELLRRLNDETAGNPFFVEELWASGPQAGEVPASVREVLARRVSAISEPTRVALAGAAIVGLEFDTALVEAATGLSADEVLDATDEALGAGLLVEVAGTIGRYRFASALVRQDLDESLSAARRSRLHWRVATWVADRFGEDPARASEVAYHYCQGAGSGDPLLVVRACQRAGEVAASQAAHEEAIVHFREGLSMLDRVAVPDPDLRYELLAGFGTESATLADLGSATEAWSEALLIARDAADPHRFCQALVGSRAEVWVPYTDGELLALIDEGLRLAGADSAERAVLLAWRAGIDTSLAARPAAAKDLDVALTLARRQGDPATLAAVLEHATRALWGTPLVAQRVAFAEEWRATVVGAGLGLPLAAEREIALAFLEQGDRQQADAMMARVAKTADRVRNRFYRYAAAVYASTCALMEGRFADSRRRAREAQEIGGADNLAVALTFGGAVMNARLEEGRADEVVDAIAGITAWSPDVSAWTAVLATTYVELERMEEARALLVRMAVPELASTPRDWFFPLAIGRLSELCVALDDADSAAHVLSSARGYTGQLLVVGMGSKVDGAGDRAIAHLLAAQKHYDEADHLYREAARLEESVGATALLARTRYWHARMLARAGGPDKRVTELLDHVLAITEDIGMRRLHREALRAGAMGARTDP